MLRLLLYCSSWHILLFLQVVLLYHPLQRLLLHQNLSFRESTGCVLLFAAVVLAQLPLGRLMRSKA